jgi:ATP-binding cassette subfamily B (MDR/TAP) protein 1
MSFSRGLNATRNRSRSRGSVTCNYCKKPGHVRTEYHALKAKNRKFTHKGSCNKEVNFCGSSSRTLRSTIGDTLKDDPNILNVESTTEAELLLTTEDATSWLLDSGASYHVTPFRTQFWSYTARSLDPVRVGNSQHCAVIGIGSIELNLPGDSTIVLHDVWHVPELTRSLISVGQLDEADFRTSFSSGEWSIHKGNLLLARGRRIQSLYPLFVTLRESDLFVVDMPMSSL